MLHNYRKDDLKRLQTAQLNKMTWFGVVMVTQRQWKLHHSTAYARMQVAVVFHSNNVPMLHSVANWGRIEGTFLFRTF